MKNMLIVTCLIVALGLPIIAQAELVDHGNGLIYDTVQNITWYDAPRVTRNQPDSVLWATNLSVTDVNGVSITGWRLPSTMATGGGDVIDSEMADLYYNGLGNTYSNFVNSGPFVNLVPNDITLPNLNYWTGNLLDGEPGVAWDYHFQHGFQHSDPKGNLFYALAVHDGKVGEPIDTDSDGTLDCNDNCPNDSNKTEAGECGCGIADVDTDGDGAFDCNDNLPPAGTMSINNGDTYTTSNDVLLDLNITGAEYMCFSNDNLIYTDWETYASSKNWNFAAGDGLKTVYVKVKDTLGNSVVISDSITFDATAPSGSVVIDDNAEYTTSQTVTLNLDVADAVYMCFSNDGENYTEWEPYSDTKSWSLSAVDGSKTVYVNYKDEAGNISTVSANINLDTTAPSGTIAIDEGSSYSMTRDVSLALESDDAVEMKLSNDDLSYSDWEPYAVFKDWVLSAGDGVKSVYVKLKDAVGNVATYSDTIILDSTPPAGNMIVNNEAEYSTEKEVSISLTTDNAAYVCFSNDGTNYNGWQPYTDNTTWTLSDSDGSKTVYVKYKDEAGNTFVISENIILDSTAPMAPVLHELGRIDNNQPTFDWDIVSDADHYILEYADNPDFQISELVDAIGPSEYELNSPLKDGIWYWRVFAVDLAGNESDWSITGQFTIDTADRCYYGPEKPILQSPSNGANDVSLTPVLTIQKQIETPVCNYPLKTRWRISKDSDFKGLIAKVNSESKDLDSYKISELMLEPNTTYYWKVRFLGSQGNNSNWSNIFSFTTQPAEGDDGDDDGIIDEQKVDDTDDLDNDGTPDNEQKIEIKSFRSKKGNLKFGMRSSNSDIICAKALYTESVDDNGKKPGQVPYGLMSYRVNVPQYGAKATIKIFLSKPAPKNAKWVFYDSLNGWLDFSDHAVFNKSRTEITVEIKDGGYGDNDHTENKIIVDPSGIGIFDSGSSDAGGGGSSGGSCFISTIVPW